MEAITGYIGDVSHLSKPAFLHAILVHFPVALAVLGVPLVLLAAMFDRERSTLRWLTVASYLLLTGFAFAAVETGEKAHALVPNTIAPALSAALERHEFLAEKVWMFAAGTAAVALLSAIKIKSLRAFFTVLAFLASVATAGWVGLVGHFGGTIVHQYGLTAGVVASGTAPTGQVPGARQGVEAPSPTTPTSPTGAEQAAPGREVFYDADIKPLMDQHCVKCHSGGTPAGGIDLSSLEAMFIPGRKAGPGIVPFKPEESSILLYCEGKLQPQMPKNAPPLSEADIETLRAWIAGGARANAGSPSVDVPAPAAASASTGDAPVDSESRLLHDL